MKAIAPSPQIGAAQRENAMNRCGLASAVNMAGS
jgi:hypothetical protein